ncbi:MAG TPA: VOC family protein [Caulobacteraceae bacterium]|nr:VOC family protein [Caulobacteraceae bacterium]
MAFALGPLGQIALSTADIDKAEDFFGAKLGLRKLFRFGTMSFFDCAGVRLLVEQTADGKAPEAGSPLYFRVADIALARKALEARGVNFIDEPHLIAPMEDHDLWMTFCRDDDGHMIALMCEAPKGYQPKAAG